MSSIYTGREIAIFTDLHGLLEPFEAIIADIQKRGILIDDAELVLPVILNDWNIHEMTLSDTSVNVEVLKSLRKIDI